MYCSYSTVFVNYRRLAMTAVALPVAFHCNVVGVWLHLFIRMWKMNSSSCIVPRTKNRPAENVYRADARPPVTLSLQTVSTRPYLRGGGCDQIPPNAHLRNCQHYFTISLQSELSILLQKCCIFFSSKAFCDSKKVLTRRLRQGLRRDSGGGPHHAPQTP